MLFGNSQLLSNSGSRLEKWRQVADCVDLTEILYHWLIVVQIRTTDVASVARDEEACTLSHSPNSLRVAPIFGLVHIALSLINARHVVHLQLFVDSDAQGSCNGIKCQAIVDDRAKTSAGCCKAR